MHASIALLLALGGGGFVAAQSASNSSTNAAFPPFTGNPFVKYNISAPGIKASFIPYGARVTNIFVNDRDGKPQDVIMGYDTGEQYLNDSETVHTFFGAVVGRYANRIKNGSFELPYEGAPGASKYQVPENDNMGHDTLHGGTVGYDQRNWTVAAHTANSITFQYFDQAEEGFPGNVVNVATYTLDNDDMGNARWTSRLVSIPLTDTTPIMLANHVYWNLGAFTDPSMNNTVLNDTLWMPYADRTPAIDNIEVPNGTISILNDGPYDFTTPKKVGRDIEQTLGGCGYNCTGYDTCFIMDRPRYASPDASDMTLLSWASPLTGIRLDLATNQAALQIYSCDGLNGTITAKSDQQHTNGTTTYGHYECLVLETEDWIDGINNPQWGRDEYQLFSPSSRVAENYATYVFSNATDTFLNM